MKNEKMKNDVYYLFIEMDTLLILPDFIYKKLVIKFKLL